MGRGKSKSAQPKAASVVPVISADGRLEVPHISGLQVAFGIPAMPRTSIPKQYHCDGADKWASRLFFRGSDGLSIKAKDGIDGPAAIRAVKATLASFESKHEDKMATVAYMLDQWFDISEVSAS